MVMEELKQWFFIDSYNLNSMRIWPNQVEDHEPYMSQ